MAEKWSLAGAYFETCNCNVACPCVFLSPPTDGECTLLSAWHIEKGKFGNTDLDGLNVALAVHSPGHMAQVKWKAAIYLDEKASQSQKDALIQIFGGQAGGHPAVLCSFVGEVLGVKSVPIKFEAEGKRRRIEIAGIAQAEIEALQGQGGEDITINNHILAISPGEAGVVSKSKQLSYADYGMKWELSNKTGTYSPFSYRGP